MMKELHKKNLLKQTVLQICQRKLGRKKLEKISKRRNKCLYRCLDDENEKVTKVGGNSELPAWSNHQNCQVETNNPITFQNLQENQQEEEQNGKNVPIVSVSEHKQKAQFIQPRQTTKCPHMCPKLRRYKREEFVPSQNQTRSFTLPGGPHREISLLISEIGSICNLNTKQKKACFIFVNID